jgi:hypothetical protein
MKYLDYPLQYIGQTCREFHTRYREHIQAIRSNNGNSGYSNHILNTGHTYGNITDTMEIIKTEKKGKHMNTLERYHIHKISKDKLHMNDTYIDTHNPIFEILEEHTQLSPPPTYAQRQTRPYKKTSVDLVR